MNRLLVSFTFLLGFGVIASGVGVVYSKYLNRKQFVQLQGLIQACDTADTRWLRLQLEESALATYARIETVARDRLQMHLPGPGEVQILR